MSQCEIRVLQEIQLPMLRLELVQQESCGPFSRTHRLSTPSITYIPPASREAARGCFGIPVSHRELATIGAAVITLTGKPFHLVSPGFSQRDILVCHFEPSAFNDLSGLDIDPSGQILDACLDVRSFRIIETLDRMLSELEGDGLKRDTVLTGYGWVLLGELSRYFANLREHAATTLGMLAPWQLRRIDQRIADENLQRPKIAELAELCGIGQRHLMRSFKATRGMTVLAYMERAVFARAIRLLQTTDMPLKQLAVQLGYTRQSSFSAAFSRHFGDTPHGYRARRRNVPREFERNQASQAANSTSGLRSPYGLSN